MINNFSIVIICRDAAETLEKCLESVAKVKDVVLYDNGSQDQSIAIARRYSNVRIIQGEFFGFGPTKNLAIDLAENDWVFSLDSDEAISDMLWQDLEKWQPIDENHVYEVERHNYLMGRRIRYAGWGNDMLVRLFNRKVHRFTPRSVHEYVGLTCESRRSRLAGPITHQAVGKVSDMLDKVNRYSELPRGANKKVLPAWAFFSRACWAFLRSYLFQLGFLEGVRGLLIAVSNFNGVFFKYMKAYSRRYW